MPPSTLNEYSLSKSLKSAASLPSPNNFKSIHSTTIKLGLSQFHILMTSLIDLYLKFGLISDAHSLFDELPHKDVVAWTSMIVGHARQGFHRQSLSLFRRMLKTSTIPNGYSFSGALIACSGLGDLNSGKEIHAQVIKMRSFGPIDPVVLNGFLRMYAKCRTLSYARNLFDSMPIKGIITWNEMMSGCLYCGQAELALKLLSFMISNGVRPDDFSYSICTDACTGLASMRQGIQIHACIMKDGFDSDLVIRNSLVDMYAKCGCIAAAKLVFDVIPSRDSVLWTVMISAFGKCGFVREAISMFEEMRKLNIERDEISYLAVLSACSHGGLVTEGWHYFRSMSNEEKTISPKSEHYGCMVDLLSRSDRLDEALNFIKHMPLEPSIAVWSAFLNSCRMYGSAELGRLAASRLLELDPDNHSNWVVLSSIHAAESEWSETWRIRESMKGESVKKEPGCSWVEVNDGVRVFLTADRGYPEVSEILRSLYTCEFEDSSERMN